MRPGKAHRVFQRMANLWVFQRSSSAGLPVLRGDFFCFGRFKCHRPPCARCSKARMASPRSCGCIRMHSLFGCHLPKASKWHFLLLSVAFSTLPVSFSNSDCLQRNFWVGPRAIVIATFVWHPESFAAKSQQWLVTSCDNWGPLQIWSSHQSVESQDCRKNPPTTLHRYHDHLALSTFLFWDQSNGRMDGSERFSKSATYNTYWLTEHWSSKKQYFLSRRSGVSWHWDPSRPPGKASMYSLRIQIAS